MQHSEQKAFEEKLAQLESLDGPKGPFAKAYDATLRFLWWICCCFCFATNPNKPETRHPWAVTSEDGHIARPAHLKISTSDKRAVEVKIVYAVNPNMSSQLYEVDVFMFFLKDLEAVSNNFYHDLWQVARLHTPKISLAMLAADSSVGFTGLIAQELQYIARKRAAGEEGQCVQVQVDSIVQQLRLHVCIFRNSVRRALKGISQALERLEGSQAGAAQTLQACRAVTTVVGQIAQTVHRLQQVCLPCEAADAPDAVKTVWKLVDEYTLMEAERAMLKLMRGLDKHLKHVKQTTAAAGPDITESPSITAVAAQPEMCRVSPTAGITEEAAATAALQQIADVEQNDMQRSQSSAQPGLQGAASMYSGQDPQASAYANATSPQQQQQPQANLSSQYSYAGTAPNQGLFEDMAAGEGTRADQDGSNQQLASVVLNQQQPAWPVDSQHRLVASTSGNIDGNRQAAANQQSMTGVYDFVQRPANDVQDSRHAIQDLPSQSQHQLHADSNDQSAQRLFASISGSRQVTQDIPSWHSGSQHQLHVGSNHQSGHRSPGNIAGSRQVTQGIAGSRQVTRDIAGSRQVTQDVPSWHSGSQHQLHVDSDHQSGQRTSRSILASGQVTQDIPGSRQVTQDMPSRQSISLLGATGDSSVSVRKSASRKRDKLEYRLSQDDVYNPTAAEVQALLHSHVGNSSQHSGQLPSSNFAALNGSTAGSGLSSALAMSAATGYAVSSMFTNPLSTPLGLEKGQEEMTLQAEDVSMLPLIHRVQAVQDVADSVDLSSHEDSQAEVQASLQVGADARQLIMEAVMHLQDERRRRGYDESIIIPNDPSCNEQYTNRIKCLKHNARAAVVLRPQLLAQSFLLADLVGMTVAGLAMCVAVGAIYVATRFTRNQLSGVYVIIIVVGYMLKDRMKEWGKRYLQPAAMKFGFEFPDRTVKMRDSRGKRVGRCKEWVKVVPDTEVDVRVLAMRHKDKGYIPPERQALKPERVLAYKKKMEVAWNQLDPRLRGVDGLDDIMRFDLQHFCRRMQPPDEPHYSLERGEDGSMEVQKIQCARVYHINVVLRIRTSVQDTRKDKAYKEKSLQIQKARIIMDQSGIKRLEATDDSVHLMADRHHVTPGPTWRPDMHMSAMHMPRVSMPRMPTFGRHSAAPEAAAADTQNQNATMLPEQRV